MINTKNTNPGHKDSPSIRVKLCMHMCACVCMCVYMCVVCVCCTQGHVLVCTKRGHKRSALGVEPYEVSALFFVLFLLFLMQGLSLGLELDN